MDKKIMVNLEKVNKLNEHIEMINNKGSLNWKEFSEIYALWKEIYNREIYELKQIKRKKYYEFYEAKKNNDKKEIDRKLLDYKIYKELEEVKEMLNEKL